jgi:nitrate reductase gamma subunit
MAGKKSRYSLGPVLGIIISNIFIDNQAFLFYTAVCLRGVFVIYFNVENVDKDKLKEKQSINFKNILTLTTSKSMLIALFAKTTSPNHG